MDRALKVRPPLTLDHGRGLLNLASAYFGQALEIR